MSFWKYHYSVKFQYIETFLIIFSVEDKDDSHNIFYCSRRKKEKRAFSKSFYRVNQNKCISKQYSLKIEFAEIYSMIYD